MKIKNGKRKRPDGPDLLKMRRITEFLPKRIPYGLASFQAVRDAGLAFVDKTKVIEALERLEIRFPLLLRPRRFGKTFLTTMLEAYYDKASAADFDRLFAGTYIHAHRTASQGQFHVLRLDFSGIDSTLVVDGFIRKLLLGMSAFFKKYPVAGADEFLRRKHQM